MKYLITQTTTQTISRVVEADDREHALSMIEDADFIQSIEVQRMEQFEKDTEEWEVKPIFSLAPKYHARRCDVTGEGMNSGWVCGDDYYIKYEADLIKHLREVYKSENLNGGESLTDDELREKYYEEGYHFYTEWNSPEDILYVEEDGKVRLMKADDYKIKQLNK